MAGGSSSDAPVKMNSQQKRLASQVEISSPRFLPDTIATLARARDHLSKGKLTGAAELLGIVENRLDLYHRVVAKRFLHRE